MSKKKSAVLLLHGMGNHTAPKKIGGKATRGSFGKEFIDTCNLALGRYPQHKDQSIENHVDVFEYNYNEWFDKVRKKMADKAKSVNERLAGIAGHYNVSFPLSFAGELASLESKFGDDKFFYTHWLDVIFYSTILGAKVRVEAGREIAKLVELYGQGNVHIFAHSLGTAVAHDALALLYRPESDPDDEIPDLNLTNQKLASVWMVANVSRLLYAVTRLIDPRKSAVKPGDDGCALVFNSVRHKLDPFTWISRFSPQNNGKWVPEVVYDAFYLDTVTHLITDPNTHSVTQYIEDPNVSQALFSQLFKFKASDKELKDVKEIYRQKSIQGAYALVEEELSDLQIKDFQSWKDFLNAAKNLQDAIKLIKGELP